MFTRPNLDAEASIRFDCLSPMVDPQNQPSGQEAPLPFAPFAVEELAPLFPGLHIERLIAVGGMGAVYLGIDEKLERKVAIKTILGNYAWQLPRDGRSSGHRSPHRASACPIPRYRRLRRAFRE